MVKRNPIAKMLKDVREPLRRFLHRAVRKLYPKIVEFVKSERIDPEHVVEEDVERYQDQLCDEVSKWREFTTLQRRHDKFPILTQRLALLQKYRTEYLSLERLLLSGAGRIVFLMAKGRNLDEAADEVVLGYETLLTGKKCEVVLGASFRDLDLGDKTISLDKNTQLRNLTHSERRIMYTRDWWRTEHDREEMPGLPSIILMGTCRVVSDYLDAFPGLSDSYLQAVRSAIAFMQLYVNEELKPAQIFAFNKRWLPNPVGKISNLSSYQHPHPDPPGSVWLLEAKRHQVDAAAARQLKSAWPKYKQAIADQRYARACSRFSISLHRESHEDRIVDHWVALESLFGKGSEIAMTVALKLAILIEKKVPIRKIYRRWITTHYAIRSAIVHGGDLKTALKRFSKLVGQHMEHTVPAEPRAACIFIDV